MALFCSTVFSTTFYTMNDFGYSSRSSFYQLPLEVKVSGLNFKKENTLELNFNGENVQAKAEVVKVISSVYWDRQVQYEAVVKTDTIVPGSYCDEAEKVNYILTFLVESSHDPHSEPVVKALELKAEKAYNWDICHGSYEYEYIKYETK